MKHVCDCEECGVRFQAERRPRKTCSLHCQSKRDSRRKTLSKDDMMKAVKVSLIKNSMPEPNSGCWLWIGGGTGECGYGLLNNRIFKQAHRASYAIFKGEIPEGMCVCHKCDTPACINPDHLFIGTHLDNMRDMFRKGRRPKPKGTHCKQGHKYPPPRPSGKQVCPICENASYLRRKKSRTNQ